MLKVKFYYVFQCISWYYKCMEDSNPISTEKPEKKNKNLTKIILLTLFVTAVLAAVGAGGYFFNKYRLNVSKDINALYDISQRNDTSITELSALNGRIDALQGEFGRIQSTPSYTYTPIFADITIEKIIEDKNTALEEGYRLLILDIKLENRNSEIVYFSSSELKLKDKENYDFTSVVSDTLAVREFVKEDTKILLPENRILSGWATLNPGETIRTSIGFILNRPGTEYNLYRTDTLLRSIKL